MTAQSAQRKKGRSMILRWVTRLFHGDLFDRLEQWVKDQEAR